MSLVYDGGFIGFETPAYMAHPKISALMSAHVDAPCGRWSEGPLAVDGEAPERVSHVTALIGKRMYVLGGKSGWKVPYINDVRVCDFSGPKPSWSELDVGPTLTPVNELGDCFPIDRIGPACVAVGTEIWMYSGADGCFWLDDLWSFDTAGERPAWKLVETEGTPPEKRCYHSMVAHGKQIWVFGGLEFADYKNDLHLLDLDGAKPTWSRPKVSGAPPAGRYAHSAWMMGSVMYVFGGDHGHYCCNDLHSIDLSNPDALEWRFVEVDGVPPTPRAHVKAIPVGDRVWMYGMTRKGLHSNELKLLDFSSGKPSWSSPIALGEPPCARFGESGVAVDSNLYIFGGYGNSGNGFMRYDNMHALHIGDARE